MFGNTSCLATSVFAWDTLSRSVRPIGAKKVLKVVPRETTTQLPQANPKCATSPGPDFNRIVIASLKRRRLCRLEAAGYGKVGVETKMNELLVYPLCPNYFSLRSAKGCPLKLQFRRKMTFIYKVSNWLSKSDWCPNYKTFKIRLIIKQRHSSWCEQV